MYEKETRHFYIECSKKDSLYVKNFLEDYVRANSDYLKKLYIQDSGVVIHEKIMTKTRKVTKKTKQITYNVTGLFDLFNYSNKDELEEKIVSLDKSILKIERDGEKLVGRIRANDVMKTLDDYEK